MDNDIHFLSGLPRSGSTLLSAILRQNPKLRANISSPVVALVTAAIKEMSGANEGSIFFDNKRRASIVNGIFQGYYYDVPRGCTVIDTSRSWTSKLSLIDQLFPRAKIVCCVRNLAWIFDSFERITQKNPLAPSRIFGFDAGGNVYDRFEAINRGNGIVGSSWNSLRQGFYGPLSDRLILITYETLVRDPKQCLEKLYAHLGLEAFAHDFENVAFDAKDFDAFLSTPDLHTVRSKISYAERQAVIPPDLFTRLSNDTFWTDPAKNPRKVTVI